MVLGFGDGISSSHALEQHLSRSQDVVGVPRHLTGDDPVTEEGDFRICQCFGPCSKDGVCGLFPSLDPLPSPTEAAFEQEHACKGCRLFEFKQHTIGVAGDDGARPSFVAYGACGCVGKGPACNSFMDSDDAISKRLADFVAGRKMLEGISVSGNNEQERQHEKRTRHPDGHEVISGHGEMSRSSAAITRSGLVLAVGISRERAALASVGLPTSARDAEKSTPRSWLAVL